MADEKLFLKDVLNKCKEEGYPVTASGLYYAGNKYGFLIKKEGSRNLEFNKDGFFEWLNKAKEEVPAGWMSLNEISKKLGISLSQAYILSKDDKSGAKSFGAGPGVLYADPKRFEEIIKQRSESHKEKWSD